MTSLEDPLAKPEWPLVPDDVSDTVVSMLLRVLAPLSVGVVGDVFSTLTVGFNSTMAAVEDHISGKRVVKALLICRGDLEPQIYMPFALASSAAKIPLLALPQGTRTRLTKLAGRDIAILAILEGSNLSHLVCDIEPAKTSWAYRPAAILPRAKRPKAKQSKSS